MQLPRILIICTVAVMIVGCKSALPNALQSTTAPAGYPNPGTPMTLANKPAYPDPNTNPTADPAYPTPAELPTAAAEQPTAPPPNPATNPNESTPPLTTGANLTQPGIYTVKIISVSSGNQIIISNDTSEQMVTLVGIFTEDPAQQANCANLARDRLTLLTVNPAATYTLTVIKPDPNDSSAVIGKIVRHDSIDLGLDLVASGLALLTTDTVDGKDNYITLEAAAKAELLGRWNGPCKFSDSIIGAHQA